MHCVLKCMYHACCNVNGIELNFISLLRNFKIYIHGEMLLPLSLVRSQIKNYDRRRDMHRYVRKNFACVLYSGTL